MKISASDAIKIIALIGFFGAMLLIITNTPTDLSGLLALLVQGVVVVIVGWQPVPLAKLEEPTPSQGEPNEK